MKQNMHDFYTDKSLVALLQKVLLTNPKKMDIPLLREILQTLDDRPDDVIAPHQALVWGRIRASLSQTQSTIRHQALKTVLVVLLLLSLAFGALAWAVHAGVLSFPSFMLGIPQSAHPQAQTLVEPDLFTESYDNCELRVLEAAYDGQQIRLVYTLTDTRENVTLIQNDYGMQIVEGASLDGIGMCDYLIVNGNDECYLSEIFEMPSEDHPAQMLYYLTADIPQELSLSEGITIEMPLGAFDLETHTRAIPNVSFVLDATRGEAQKQIAKPVSVEWDNLLVEITRAEFSPLQGVVEVHYGAVDETKPYSHVELSLFTAEGEPIGHARLPVIMGAMNVEGMMMTYIPTGEWAENMVLAPVLENGCMDESRMIPLELAKEG